MKFITIAFLIFSCSLFSQDFKWKNVGNGTSILCTPGIDSNSVTKKNGVLLVKIPKDEEIIHIRIITEKKDYVYVSGDYTNGFKVKIDNSANGVTLGFSLEFLQYSTFGKASKFLPMIINSSVNLSTKGSDEMNDTGIFSMMFWDLSGITEGAIIQG